MIHCTVWSQLGLVKTADEPSNLRDLAEHGPRFQGELARLDLRHLPACGTIAIAALKAAERSGINRRADTVVTAADTASATAHPLDVVRAGRWMRVLFGTYALSLGIFEAALLRALRRVGQNVYFAGGRSGYETQRLRIVLDEGGWIALRGARRSNPTPDGLYTLLELASDCGLVSQADGGYMSPAPRTGGGRA